MEGVCIAASNGRKQHMKARLPHWTLFVDFPRFHSGRQGKVCLERGTAQICRVAIALENCPCLLQLSTAEGLELALPAPKVVGKTERAGTTENG